MARPIRKQTTSTARTSTIGLLAVSLLLAMFVGTADAANVSCGQVITESTTLTADVGPCNGDGLIVRGSNITLNLNGHSVVGALRVFGTQHWQKAATGQFAGIRLEGVTGSTVVNGTVEQFAAGVALFNSSGNTLANLNVRDNVGPPDTDFLGDGIALFRSTGNTLVRNVVRHNGPFSGVAFVGPSNDNHINNSHIVDNNLPDLNASDEAVHNEDMGVRIEGPAASRNVVSESVINGNGVNGVHLSPSCVPHPTCEATPGPNAENIVRGNEIRRNGFGHLGDGSLVPADSGAVSLYTTRRGREQLGNGYAPATRNRIERNDIRDNARRGIRVSRAATWNTFRNNTSVGHPVFDAWDQNPDCDNNTWLNNRFDKVNQPCVAGQTGQRPAQPPREEKDEDTPPPTERGPGTARRPVA